MPINLAPCSTRPLKCFKREVNGTWYEWCTKGCSGFFGIPPPPGQPAVRPTGVQRGYLNPGQSPAYIDSRGPAGPPQRFLSPATNNRITTESDCDMSCQPGCGCTNGGPGPAVIDPNTGIQTLVQPRSGTGQNLCWGAAGGEASPTLGGTPGTIAAGASGFITISVTNYSWLKPRKLTLSAMDPAATVGNMNAGAISAVRVTQVTAVGRQILGSAQGISGQAIAADSQNALTFGRDISPISSSNTIVVHVTNNGAIALRISADIEGEASQ